MRNKHHLLASKRSRNILAVAMVTTMLVVVGLLQAPAAIAQPPHGLVGKKVYLALVAGAVASDATEGLKGMVTAVDGPGVWLASTQRLNVSQGHRSSDKYIHTLFVPWTSVLYAKVLP